MSKFKVGDKVRWIDSAPSANTMKSKVYVVESIIYHKTIRLKGVVGVWCQDKFELCKDFTVEDIKEAMKVFEKFNITRSPDGLYSYGDSGIKCTTAEEFFIINSLVTSIKELHKSGDDINQGLRKVLDEVLSGKV